MRVIDWDDFINGADFLDSRPRALTVGVFDGVHRGHQVLIGRILNSPYIPTVITFRQNPLTVLHPRSHSGDIFSLDQKLRAFERLGAREAVLIDFSRNFSTIHGRDFIDMLAWGAAKTGSGESRARLLALGRNFRCGYRLDTGIREIRDHAARLGIETWAAEPVMEGGRRISSSRIRQAILAGSLDEAALLLGRPVEIDLRTLPRDAPPEPDGVCRFDAASALRITPPPGTYGALVFGGGDSAGTGAAVSVEGGKILVPATGKTGFVPARIEFVKGGLFRKPVGEVISEQA